MAVKSDSWIKRMAQDKGMIEPFEEKQVREGISYGLSSYGYDFRIGPTFKIFDPRQKKVMDPKADPSGNFRDYEGEFCDIPPGSYVLAQTIEYFRIPRDVVTICFGKSTYARCGVDIHVTPFEPEWEGHATIAISNRTPLPARIYAGEGMGQILFLQSDQACALSYADKKGKYQAQKNITLAKGNG
ncbi:MAG TPA: dCTP deaminase [bacterium]|nr:dCTP deaminase [bacterium]